MDDQPVLRCGDLVLDPAAHTVRLRGSIVDMPPQEFVLDPDDRLAANTLVNYRADLKHRIDPYPIARIRVTSLSTGDVNK